MKIQGVVIRGLDIIPAREYARIPLIETLQATYSFDLFGVCVSLLYALIYPMKIFALVVFPRSPLDLINLLIPETGVSVCIPKKIYP